jgi:hypothetical protein
MKQIFSLAIFVQNSVHYKQIGGFYDFNYDHNGDKKENHITRKYDGL